MGIPLNCTLTMNKILILCVVAVAFLAAAHAESRVPPGPEYNPTDEYLAAFNADDECLESETVSRGCFLEGHPDATTGLATAETIDGYCVTLNIDEYDRTSPCLPEVDE